MKDIDHWQALLQEQIYLEVVKIDVDEERITVHCELFHSLFSNGGIYSRLTIPKQSEITPTQSEMILHYYLS